MRGIACVPYSLSDGRAVGRSWQQRRRQQQQQQRHLQPADGGVWHRRSIEPAIQAAALDRGTAAESGSARERGRVHSSTGALGGRRQGDSRGHAAGARDQRRSRAVAAGGGTSRAAGREWHELFFLGLRRWQRRQQLALGDDTRGQQRADRDALCDERRQPVGE